MAREKQQHIPDDERSSAPTRPSRRSTPERSAYGIIPERMIAGVPARIMRPRLVFIASLTALVLFGLVMVYSASSVEALQETGNSYYYLIKQGIFIGIGVLACTMVALGKPYTLLGYRQGGAKTLMIFVLVLLLAVFALGSAAGGARRWINLFGIFTLQPSELAKPVIILLAADIFAAYFEERSMNGMQTIKQLGIMLGLPLLLIIIEPDTGSTIIIVLTVVVMAFLSGYSLRMLGMLIAAAALAFVVFVLIEPYRLTRFMVSLDPWADPFGTGYQATLAIMAFASGGVWGRGIGNSTMKYSYLPEAHNDFILAIIGEELGLVGTTVLIVLFLVMLWSAAEIARQSPHLSGKLVAIGVAIIFGVQFFVNALGILGITPMTGKTLPFISYGGSSIIASLISAGLVLRVSIESHSASPYAIKRSRFQVHEGVARDASDYIERDAVGAAGASTSQRTRGFDVVEGRARTARSSRSAERASRSQRVSQHSGERRAYKRINLSHDASARLRQSSQGPRRRDVRHEGGSRGRS
ncbi:putative lipid II flippase FtsW [Collinsella sp. zg1085]|uniref:putative lipid II flippase FtsW n=1 Tax=Collinsella sp. zg1085 TaxID=2844380 RepID=UPI001C0BC154|nr:putative lipid II flippase FtsW [Collinsella sp. zg1085]QWT18042.1 putative lipid II flippase FtsW [Collinsella sp. zg1085]